MSILLHNIDPEGDTLLILKDPLKELMTWEEEPAPEAWKILLRGHIDIAQTNSATQSSSNTRNYANGTNTESLLPISDPHEEEADSPIDEVEPEIHYRVSSGQLKLTSEYFRNMFKGNYRETSPDTDDGLLHIEAFNWDPDALLTILNIIHARANLIPRAVGLEMLAKLAQIVDYYKMGDAVSRDSERWIHTLKSTTLPMYYCQESVMWICISWVFADAEMFEMMTAVALNHSRGPIQTLDLPIPPQIIEAIDDKRQNSINAMIEGLHKTLIELRDGQRGCSFACGSMLLGSLMKHMHSNNLLSDLSLHPQTPFLGLSFEGTAEGIRSMKSPLWSNPPSDHWNKSGNAFGSGTTSWGGGTSSWGGGTSSWGSSSFQHADDFRNNNHSSQLHVCKLEEIVKPILDSAGLTMTGLKLEFFNGSA
ncbi:hypothetical protein K505DRAFT_328457 [Melanomma pulvis-pyrius CBS 109.77]|uniref:BTB domain-containing protein n=1 Tax=Melanomma pulvis-pyrius CBS 109.77 TaxID=1314802 RepID=A0A6A6WY03_9PLEO|nr:hypothetical protein K505DRAFT_328457 [Melanomma pulvis-pyrius CBS 109.77]